MKVAEALILRKEHKTLLNNLEMRIKKNFKVIKGESPNEDPNNLIEEYFSVQEKAKNLIIQINHSNLNTKLSDGTILADAIAEKDMIMDKRNMLESCMNNLMNRYDYDEKPLVPSVNISEIQKQISTLSKEYRDINTKIQICNWNTDL